MTGDVRARMIAGTAQLLAQHGLQKASFSEVLQLTGAPRGSIYHHFPGGKDELILATLDAVGARTAAALEPARGGTPRVIAELFLQLWSDLLDRAQLTAGCAVVAVTVAADSPELLDRAGQIFRNWTAHLTDLLASSGLDAEAAAEFATVLIATSEGAVLLSRAEQSRAPFDRVRAALLRSADALVANRS